VLVALLPEALLPDDSLVESSEPDPELLDPELLDPELLVELSSELSPDELSVVAVVGVASVVGVVVVDPDVVEPDATDALPVVAPPAGLAAGDIGPMNTPSTPSFRSGRQVSEPLRICTDSSEQVTVPRVSGVAATATPCGRKAAVLMITATAAGRQIPCRNMSAGPPDDLDLARIDDDAISKDGAGHCLGSADRSKGPSDPSNSVVRNAPLPSALPCAGGRAGLDPLRTTRSVGCARPRMWHTGSLPRGVLRKEGIARSWGDHPSHPFGITERAVRISAGAEQRGDPEVKMRSTGGDGLRDDRFGFGRRGRVDAAGATSANASRDGVRHGERGTEQGGERRRDGCRQ
jgi:hypothetical protein